MNIIVLLKTHFKVFEGDTNCRSSKLHSANGAILIHFSDGISVLYQPEFLYDVQNDDGNVPISNEPNKELEE